MPSTQQLLQAITGLQQNAQANLPVIPNNGNPRGANNMPANPNPQLPQPTASPYFYEWMKPSASMDMINQLLAQPIKSSFAAPPNSPVAMPTTNITPGIATQQPLPVRTPTLPVNNMNQPTAPYPAVLPRRIPGQY